MIKNTLYVKLWKTNDDMKDSLKTANTACELTLCKKLSGSVF